MALPVAEAVKSVEAVEQRRADEGQKSVEVIDLYAVFIEGIGHRSCYPLFGIGQRAVEIEEYIFFVHFASRMYVIRRV